MPSMRYEAWDLLGPIRCRVWIRPGCLLSTTFPLLPPDAPFYQPNGPRVRAQHLIDHEHCLTVLICSEMCVGDVFLRAVAWGGFVNAIQTRCHCYRAQARAQVLVASPCSTAIASRCGLSATDSALLLLLVPRQAPPRKCVVIGPP